MLCALEAQETMNGLHRALVRGRDAHAPSPIELFISITDYIAEVAHFRGAIGQFVMDVFRLGEVPRGKRLCDFLEMRANGLDAFRIVSVESTNFNRPAVAHRPECMLRRLMGKA